MSQKGMNINLSIKEIYEAACPECKKKIKELIKNKISEEMVTQVIGEKE